MFVVFFPAKIGGFLLLFCFSFNNSSFHNFSVRVWSSSSGNESGGRENVDRVLRFHITVGAARGSQASEHGSLDSWKEGEKPRQSSGFWVRLKAGMVLQLCNCLLILQFGFIPEYSGSVFEPCLNKWWWQAQGVLLWGSCCRAGQVSFISPPF